MNGRADDRRYRASAHLLRSGAGDSASSTVQSASADTSAIASSEPEADPSRVPDGLARRVLDAARTTPYVLLTVVLAAVMWPVWTMTDRLVIGGDTVAIHFPWFVLWRDLLAAGEWPFWNPYSFSGIPAFATLQAGYGYPPHWLLTPLPPIVAINWLVGLHVLLAGLGDGLVRRPAGRLPGRSGAGRPRPTPSAARWSRGSGLGISASWRRTPGCHSPPAWPSRWAAGTASRCWRWSSA